MFPQNTPKRIVEESCALHCFMFSKRFFLKLSISLNKATTNLFDAQNSEIRPSPRMARGLHLRMAASHHQPSFSEIPRPPVALHSGPPRSSPGFIHRKSQGANPGVAKKMDLYSYHLLADLFPKNVEGTNLQPCNSMVEYIVD